MGSVAEQSALQENSGRAGAEDDLLAECSRIDLVRPAVPARECFWSRACQEVAKKSLSGAGRFASGNGDFTADVMVDIAPANPTVFASFRGEFLKKSP